MPGNEVEVARYLLRRLGKIELPHLGIIESIGAPRTYSGFRSIAKESDLILVSAPDARKKADIYLNGIGVSMKQVGGSFAFNRIQRANILTLFRRLGFSSIHSKLARLDTEVGRFHEGRLARRNRPWEDFFEKNDFKKLLNFLMTKGSPNLGISKHPAELILEAPSLITEQEISVYTFGEYFAKYKDRFKIAIRRQWIGQASQSEHTRAVSLVRKPGNAPWVFEDVVGCPRSGWRTNFPRRRRKTVYFLMIEKVSSRKSKPLKHLGSARSSNTSQELSFVSKR